MTEVSLKDAKSAFSSVVDQAAAGDFITITRHGKPAAVIVSLEAAEAAKAALRKGRSSLVRYLQSFPADIHFEDEIFARNPAKGRDVDL